MNEESKITHTIPLGTYSVAEFLKLALRAVELCGWTTVHISETGFLVKSGFNGTSLGEDILFDIVNGTATLISSSANSGDTSKHQENVNNFLHAFNEAAALQNKTSEAPVREEETPLSFSGKVKAFFDIFKPAPGYFITPIIINLNILVFLLMVFSGVSAFDPTGQELLDWGACYRPVTLDGQAWRLLTACFLHIGIIHLALNMFALAQIGILLERFMGSVRYAAAYILAGLTGSLVSLYWHHNTICAGASGAIFGMYGVFLAFLTTNLVERTARKELLTSTLTFVGYNLLFGLKGGIDNAAHLGGLIGGLLIGYAFYASLKYQDNARLLYGTISGLAIAIVTACAFAVFSLPNDIGEYQKKMARFTELEERALKVYEIPAGAPETEIKNKLNAGIADWTTCLEIVKEIGQYALPDEVLDRNIIVGDYCRLRIRIFNLHFRSIVEHTEEYDEEIESCNKQIESILTRLNTQGNKP